MDYQTTYSNEIFVASQCLQREATVTELIRQSLQDYGFKPAEECGDVYYRGSQRVIVSVVDDVEHSNHFRIQDIWSTFTCNDIIITDNYITRPIPAKIIKLPISWFGIYYHDPKFSVHLPDRAFTLPINRIDTTRIEIFLRMYQLGHLRHGYVNLNCANHKLTQTMEDKKNLWRKFTKDFTQARPIVDSLTDQMPFRNHELDHDTACQSGGLNIVTETYTSDYSITFSEKIFRALVIPRPWILFGGTWAVSRLESLGFDVMRDLINHSYDGLRMSPDKISEFVAANKRHWGRYNTESQCDSSLESYQRWYRRFILPRASRAAQHNKTLLKRWRQQWWQDIPTFLQTLHLALEKNEHR